MTDAKRRSTCPVACSLDLIGDRWTLLVVRDLLLGKSRFNEFLASPEKIPTNILTDRLRRLEEAGVLQRDVYSYRPTRYAYGLTERGLALRQSLDALAQWGLEQFPGTRRALRGAAVGSESADVGVDEASGQ